MPCNCGKKNAAPLQYVFTAPNGATQTYNSEVAAKAAKIRAGGGKITPRR
jgi:hypothetical protein